MSSIVADSATLLAFWSSVFGPRPWMVSPLILISALHALPNSSEVRGRGRGDVRSTVGEECGVAHGTELHSVAQSGTEWHRVAIAHCSLTSSALS